MLEARLLTAAADLCRRTGSRPREAFMRRAVSTAYYAVFHALCRMCADALVGGGRWQEPAYARTYRAVEHRSLKDILRNRDEVAVFGPELINVLILLGSMQDLRHRADYDPTRFEQNYDETEALIGNAQYAIEVLNGLPIEHRLLLATLILFKQRKPVQ